MVPAFTACMSLAFQIKKQEDAFSWYWNLSPGSGRRSGCGGLEIMNFHGHVEQLQSARPKQSGWQLSPGFVFRVTFCPSLPGLNEATHRWRGCATTLLPGRWADIWWLCPFLLYNHLELFKLSNLRFLYFFHVHHRLCRSLGWLVGTQRRWVAALDPLQSLHAADFHFWFQRPAFFALRWLHNKNEMAYFHLSSCLIFAATVFI